MNPFLGAALGGGLSRGLRGAVAGRQWQVQREDLERERQRQALLDALAQRRMMLAESEAGWRKAQGERELGLREKEWQDIAVPEELRPYAGQEKVPLPIYRVLADDWLRRRDRDLQREQAEKLATKWEAPTVGLGAPKVPPQPIVPGIGMVGGALGAMLQAAPRPTVRPADPLRQMMADVTRATGKPPTAQELLLGVAGAPVVKKYETGLGKLEQEVQNIKDIITNRQWARSPEEIGSPASRTAFYVNVEGPARASATLQNAATAARKARAAVAKTKGKSELTPAQIETNIRLYRGELRQLAARRDAILGDYRLDPEQTQSALAENDAATQETRTELDRLIAMRGGGVQVSGEGWGRDFRVIEEQFGKAIADEFREARRQLAKEGITGKAADAEIIASGKRSKDSRIRGFFRDW